MNHEIRAGLPDRLFEAFLRNLHGHALFALSTEGRITTWNITAERMFGYTADEAIGVHFSQFYVPEEVENCVPERELTEVQIKGQASDDRWLVRKDGTRFWASGVTIVLKEGEKLIGFAKFIRDLSEWKAVEEQRKSINEQLKSTNEKLTSAQDALQDRINDLEKFEEAVVGRELVMIRLEQEIQGLRKRIAELEGNS